MSGDRSLNWFLVSLAVGPSGRREFELVSGENLIGRKRGVSINLPHLDVSREHCIIFSVDGNLALIDSGSQNGTYVNGQKISSGHSTTLFENDTIGFGTSTSTVESYDSKKPFLVYRITKKMSQKVFEKLAQEKKEQMKRKAETNTEEPALKRVKCENGVNQKMFNLHSTSTIPTCSTTGTSNDLLEFFVKDSSGSSNSPPTSYVEITAASHSEKKTPTVKIEPFRPTATTSSTAAVVSKSLATKPFFPSPVKVSSNVSNIPTFSLISDDEDDDVGMMSQIFVKDDNQTVLSAVSARTDPIVVEDELSDIYDSEEESFFEAHLSQSFSQSFAPLAKIEPKTTKSVSGSKKEEKTDKKTSKSTKARDKSAESVAENKELLTIDGSTGEGCSGESPSKSKSTRKRQSEAKNEQLALSCDAKRKSSRLAEVVRRSGRERSSKAVDKKSKSFDLLDEMMKTSTTTNSVEDAIRKIIESQPDAKRTQFVEPHTLTTSGKENRRLASSSSKVPVRPKRRVTFKERLTDVKEFECTGKMKKTSTMPAHLLKEHPTKTPSFQWNGLLLRGCSEVADICQWNLKWLQEFQRVEVDPPLDSFHPSFIEGKFDNFHDYQRTMLCLIKHEMWGELCRIHLEQTQTQRFNIFSGTVEHIELNFDKKTHFVRCKVVTSLDFAQFLPNFGDLVGVQILSSNKERTPLYESFGVVTKQLTRERVRNTSDNSVPGKNENDKSVVCPIEVLIRASKTHNVTNGFIVQFRVYKNISNQVKYFFALKKLSGSPLKSVILNPMSCANKQRSHDSQEIKLPPRHYYQFPLNQQQKDAVAAIINSVKSEDHSVNLIHGPPGTGKSSTIASIIMRLLPLLRKPRRGPSPKILLCAPSNTAIDELVLKLLNIRKHLADEDKFKLTRVGNVKMMNPTVTDVSSVTLASRTLKLLPDQATLETEVMLLRARVQGFKNGMSSARSKMGDQQKYTSAIDKCETRLSFYLKTLANIKSGRAPHNPCENRKLLYQEECSIISGAEIIATTLCSSSTKKISDALSDSTQFACCIIDEATQATEPEVLIPLLHDVRHLVLVGDPQQLGPTVTSRFAKDKNFECSLYHRMMAEWTGNKSAPLYPLREQYRMQAEIVSFPSTTFYNSELKTPDFLYRELPFSPYHVVSHPWPENANEESNDKEARFIVELVLKLSAVEQFQNLSVGIVVPYQSQRSILNNLLLHKNQKILSGLVVNTIDSFQGQEKDVIILSCVRTKRIGFLSDRHRLNVALTRAKRCLLVVGNFQALKSDEVWSAMLADAKARNRYVEANPNDRIAPSIIFSKLFVPSNREKTLRAANCNTNLPTRHK